MHTSSFADILKSLQEDFVRAHPRSRDAIDLASRWMPGGNTRSVLHYDPFPLVITGGRGPTVTDLDGHGYLDCVGEFSAGLYGHSEPLIRAAVETALAGGWTLGGPNLLESRLAEAVCARFPSVERVRFCNSGTEANLLALVTAKAFTRRDLIVVFDGAYHGGVLTFPAGGSPTNVPFEWKVLTYNDSGEVAGFMAEHGREVAAILVEPILGAAGNINGTDEFLKGLRRLANDCGALLIFDEVKTSRCGPTGVQGLCGVTPDLTTLGKYLGGGLTLGAFGGRADIMALFDPRRGDALKHAGTFNNNVLSMAAGLTGLTEVFTAGRAADFHATAEAFKARMNRQMAGAGLPVHFTGHGSMMSFHVGPHSPTCAAGTAEASRRLRRLVHLQLVRRGVLITGRGDVYLSLPMQSADLGRLAEGLELSIAAMLPFVH